MNEQNKDLNKDLNKNSLSNIKEGHTDFNSYLFQDLLKKEIFLEKVKDIPIKSIHINELSFLNSLIIDNKLFIHNAMYYLSKYQSSNKILEPIYLDILELKQLEENNKVDLNYFEKLQSLTEKIKNIKFNFDSKKEDTSSLTKELYISDRIKSLLIEIPLDLIEDYNKKYIDLSENVKSLNYYDSPIKIKTKEEMEFTPMIVLHSNIEYYLELFNSDICSLDTLIGLLKFKKLIKETSDRTIESESLIPLAVIMAASVYIKNIITKSNS